MSDEDVLVEPVICRVRHARAGDFETVRRHYGLVQQAHAAHMPEVFRPVAQWDFPFVHFDWFLKGNNLLLIAEVDGQPAGSLLAILDTVGDQHPFCLPETSRSGRSSPSRRCAAAASQVP